MNDNIATIGNYGDAFMDLLCRDACDGIDVGRVGLTFIKIWLFFPLNLGGEYYYFFIIGYLVYSHILGSIDRLFVVWVDLSPH